MLSWTGAAVLIAYGGADTLTGGLALSGVFGAVPEQSRTALIGHVALWDPLFLIWGVLLAAGLLLDRRERRRVGPVG